MFLSEQDYLERLQDFFPKRSINLAASKTLLDFSIWKNVVAVFSGWELGAPHQYPSGPRTTPRSLAVSLGGGWVWVEALCIPLKPLGCFVFNLFCLFVNLFPNVHRIL